MNIGSIKIRAIIFVLLLFGGNRLLAQVAKDFEKAETLSQQGSYDASTALLEKIIEDTPRRFYHHARAYFMISYNYMQLGNFEQALFANQESLTLKDRLHTDDVAENFMRMGTITLLQGDYEQALSYLYRAKELPQEDPQLFGLINGYLAATYTQIKLYEKARKLLSESLGLLQIELGGDHPDMATNHYQIGRTYLLEGKLTEAEAHFSKALAIEQQTGSERETKGQIYNALGEVARMNLESETARSYYENALECLEKRNGKYHREVGRTFLNMASLELEKGRLSQAQQAVQQAMLRLCPDFNSTNFLDNPSLEDVSIDQMLLARSLQIKALIFLADYEKSANLASLQNALGSARAGIANLEEQMNYLSGDESRLHQLEDQAGVFATALLAASILYEQTEEDQYLAEAFTFAEKGKAGLLRTNLTAVTANGPLLSDFQKKEKQLQQQLQKAQVEFRAKPEDSEAKKSLVDQRRKYNTWVEELKQSAPDLYHYRFNPAVITIDQVRKNLSKSTTLLSYYIAQDHYYIFSLTSKNARLVRLPHNYQQVVTESQGWVGGLLKQTSNKGQAGVGVYSKLNLDIKMPALPRAIDDYLRAIKKVNLKEFLFYSNSLYGKLIFPVKKEIKGKKELIIIPHGALNAVPFEAMIDQVPEKEENASYAKLNYLVKEYDILYHHSATLYFDQNTEEANQKEVFYFTGFAPVFDENSGTGYIWNSHEYLFDTTYQKDLSLRSATPDGRRFTQLKYTEEEVVEQARLFAKKKKESNAFIREEATEQRFKKQADQARILHLATHSFVNEANPALSGIAFAQPSEESPDEDGILYASEIAELNLQADLVVLSSCESGSGKIVPGEGVLSLSRSFLQSGVQNVICSYWKVYDNYTAQLMSSFYQEVLNKENYSNSLRSAKLKMIKNKNTADPKKWSGFVLLGKG